MPCGIVFRSVGYRGVELPGVPFDAGSGTIPNEGGRVRPGLYVAGWIKRGPSGVIGTNKKDATETVELLLDDARAGVLPPASGADLEELLGERDGRPRPVLGLGGDRLGGADGGRAAGPAPREALHVGRAARGRPHPGRLKRPRRHRR